MVNFFCIQYFENMILLEISHTVHAYLEKKWMPSISGASLNV